MATKTYDPSQVSVIVGGNIITNFEKVSVSRDEDNWKFQAGSSGEVTRTKNSNPLGTIEIELSQTVAEQVGLSALVGTDALIPINVADLNGTSIHTMPEGSVMKVADAEYGKDDATTRTWTLKGALTVHVVGGN